MERLTKEQLQVLPAGVYSGAVNYGKKREQNTVFCVDRSESKRGELPIIYPDKDEDYGFYPDGDTIHDDGCMDTTYGSFEILHPVKCIERW